MFYKLFVPKQAPGASGALHFDLFNATSAAADVYVHSVRVIVSGDTAISGVTSADMLLTRTSAVGTGGTAATYAGTTLTAATITPIDCDQPCPPGITARLTPTGGATAGGVIALRSVFTEETNAGSYTPALDFVKNHAGDPPLYVRPGTGIRVVQDAVTGLGKVAYDVLFEVRPK